MADKTFSVLVDPGEWEGSSAELARRLVPLVRLPAAQVLPLLERGPMTIEADLSREEAARLKARLGAMGVPARVVGEVERAAPAPKLPPPIQPAARDPLQELNELEAAKKPDDLAELEGSIDPAVFDELEDFLDAELFEEAPGEAAKVRGEGAPEMSFGAEPAEASPKEEPPKLPVIPAPAASAPPLAEALQGEEEQDEEAAEAADEGEAGFDPLRIDEALDDYANARPPYAPEGFDDRIEHVPAFAAALSFLAPGAGQIYNGQPEMVREICAQAPLVRPWWESVRQAQDRAEEIRAYWAPRPAPGALKRALKHLAKCWVVGLVALSLMVWAGSAIYRLVLVPDAPTIAQAELPEALRRAGEARQSAQRAGVEAAREGAREEQAPVQQFTMSEEERAERLFRRGYAFCEADDFAACAAAMKRVSALSSGLRRKAVRLQAWANLRYNSESTEAMPDVGPVESLAAYELEILEHQP